MLRSLAKVLDSDNENWLWEWAFYNDYLRLWLPAGSGGHLLNANGCLFQKLATANC